VDLKIASAHPTYFATSSSNTTQRCVVSRKKYCGKFLQNATSAHFFAPQHEKSPAATGESIRLQDELTYTFRAKNASFETPRKQKKSSDTAQLSLINGDTDVLFAIAIEAH
jgi:hypothetical protein